MFSHHYFTLSINYTGGAKNIGERTVIGLDLHSQIEVPLFKSTQLWAYYSLILKQEETKFNAEGTYTGKGIIGDLSTHKLNLGLNSYLTKDFNVNITAQYRVKVITVETNPLKNVPAYFVMNGNLWYNNFFVKDLKIGISIINILNTKYFHPGLRQANSGNKGGEWQGREWIGSEGWYNSYLPQPRRYFTFNLYFNI